MNQGFKLRFDQMRESNPTPSEDSSERKTVNDYAQPDYARRLCLNWPDGRMMFLNYAYLVAGEFIPSNDQNLIKLSFSSHLVSLHGYSLETLFLMLLDHQLRTIAMVDPRYAENLEHHEPIVTTIHVEKL